MIKIICKMKFFFEKRPVNTVSLDNLQKIVVTHCAAALLQQRVIICKEYFCCSGPRTTCPDDPNSLQKVCCNRLRPLCSLDNFVGSDRPLFAKRQLFGMICKSLPTSVFLFFRFYSFLLVPLKTCYQASHLSSSLKRGFSGLSPLPLMLSYSCERTNLSRGSISLFFRFVISHWLCPLSPVWQTNKKQRERPPWKKLENL